LPLDSLLVSNTENIKRYFC